MTRLERLHNLKSHPMIGKDFKRLKQDELNEVILFVGSREHLSDDQFMHEANRFKLGQEKGRNYSIQWSLLIQTVDTTKNLKRRK